MGEKMLSVTLMTLLMFLGIDWFSRWYDRFLQKWVSTSFRISLIRLIWVISALLFWYALVEKALPEDFTLTHFAFALFVFSLFGLIRSFFRKSE